MFVISVDDTPKIPVPIPEIKAPGVVLLNMLTAAAALEPLVLPKSAVFPPPAFTRA